MAEIVAREDAKTVADDVIEAAARQIEIDVPGFLFRCALVEQAARHECRGNRIVARAPRLGRDRRRCYGGRGCPCGSGGRGPSPFPRAPLLGPPRFPCRRGGGGLG